MTFLPPEKIKSCNLVISGIDVIPVRHEGFSPHIPPDFPGKSERYGHLIMVDPKNNNGMPENDEELNSKLVDIFRENEDDDGDTRRISSEELHEIRSHHGFAGVNDSQDDELSERDYRPVRQRRDGKLGCLGGVMYAVFVISLSVILACGGWMCASDVLAFNKADVSVMVNLPKDIFTEKEVDVKDEDGKVTGTKTVLSADIDAVAERLKDGGVIEYKWLFKLYAAVSGADQKLDPGTYELSTKYDYRAIIKNMQVGTESMLVTTLTFPEGYTMAQIFKLLEENDICSAEALYGAAASYNYSYAFLEEVETGDALRLEGFIFPNTYDFYQGEQASSVINKFLSALHYQITADMWLQCEQLGITFREAVTIASLIEKEAANDDERAQIASVIYNRLASGMTLDIDSTILYVFPEHVGVNIPSEILNYDSPYNTKLYTGLPPTPICNPGMASIKAALQPASTNYYYYALDTATGTHRFFTNYDEHQAFVATQDYSSYE